jgi:hypothetical protein
MPRLANRNPSYRRHKASGQAVVTLNGQDVYLGPFKSVSSKREYDRVVGEYLARGRQLEGTADTRRVADVIKAYWDFARGYYSGPQCRTELGSFRLALGVLRRLYGETLARDFGPVALQTVRDAMIKLDWSRSYVNKQVGRLKRCFKWAASQELIPPAVFHGLQAVGGLRRGKTNARETDPVQPVPDACVDATIPHVGRQVAGLIRLQWASADSQLARQVEFLHAQNRMLRRRLTKQVRLSPDEKALLVKLGQAVGRKAVGVLLTVVAYSTYRRYVGQVDPISSSRRGTTAARSE